MSLFETKEWWRTRCAANETFDGQSLLAAALFGEERGDVLVVTSHEGYLRIYRPSSRWHDETESPSPFRSTDLLMEARIGECIVDARAGKFVSGSQDPRLAVLTDSKLLVYEAILTEGSTELGDRCELRIAYEHSLPRFPASLTTGPFGGVRGRDFLCVQCLDGTLLFYEQEVFAFSQVLRNRLLAAPIVYVPRGDAFVAASSSWAVECYRYQNMAERSGGSGGTVEPDWRFDTGEPVLGIEAVALTSFELAILVLGQKQLCCLKDSGATPKYAKRLEYRPVCLRAYVIEPDGKLMVMVVAESGALMLYEGSRLAWSARLPFPPVAVARVHLRHLQGAIVALAEDGRLEACYLGSEPSLFVAPPLHPRGYDYAAAEKRLAELRDLLGRRASGAAGTADAEPTVSVTMTVAAAEREEDERPSWPVAIELSAYARLEDVQVCVDADEPLRVDPTFYSVPILCERHATLVTVRADGVSAPTSAEIRATVSYRAADGGAPGAVRRTARLPLRTLLRSWPVEAGSGSGAAFAIAVKSSESLPGLARLFPEFRGEQGRLGLRHEVSGGTVTVVSGGGGNRYRVQASDEASSALVVQRLIEAVRDRSLGSLGTSARSSQLQLVQQRIEAHLAARREIEAATREIGLLASQLRSIERRLVRTVRERSDRSLASTGLPFLFEASCAALFARLEELARARTERERLGRELRASVRLLLLLLGPSVPEEKLAALEAAIGFEPRPAGPLDWEEVADAALAALLRSVSRKPRAADAGSSAGTGLAPIAGAREAAKLKRRLAQAVERLDGSREAGIAEIEAADSGGHASA